MNKSYDKNNIFAKILRKEIPCDKVYEDELSFRDNKLDLRLILNIHESYPEPSTFFLENGFFNLLAGNDKLQKQIIDHCSFDEIKDSWSKDLKAYAALRKLYLLYPDLDHQN